MRPYWRRGVFIRVLYANACNFMIAVRILTVYALTYCSLFAPAIWRRYFFIIKLHHAVLSTVIYDLHFSTYNGTEYTDVTTKNIRRLKKVSQNKKLFERIKYTVDEVDASVIDDIISFRAINNFEIIQ